MEAKVALTLTPQEFDLIRAALLSHKRTLEARINNAAPGDIQGSRRSILGTNDLIAKLS